MRRRGADASAMLDAAPAEDAFEFLERGRGVIRGFVQGRDRINIAPLGLTPDDLTISIEGRDLVLAFEGGEVVLKDGAQLQLSEEDFRF